MTTRDTAFTNLVDQARRIQQPNESLEAAIVRCAEQHPETVERYNSARVAAPSDGPLSFYDGLGTYSEEARIWESDVLPQARRLVTDGKAKTIEAAVEQVLTNEGLAKRLQRGIESDRASSSKQRG